MWLLKTEPGDYAYADLERQGRARWDGVTNPVALKNLRAMKVGERAFVYHTGDEKAVVGEAEIVRAAYADPAAADPRRLVVDLEARGRFGRPVTLAELRPRAEFAASPLLKQARLSVVPLSAAQWKLIEKLGRR